MCSSSLTCRAPLVLPTFLESARPLKYIIPVVVHVTKGSILKVREVLVELISILTSINGTYLTFSALIVAYKVLKKIQRIGRWIKHTRGNFIPKGRYPSENHLWSGGKGHPQHTVIA